jgi:pyridoxamine 5'-phosphate oxidase
MLQDHKHTSPFELFEQWFSDAHAHPAVGDHTEMTLATASKDGMPSARVVLLKSVDERGFVFYTNLASHKSKNLHDNPRAELNFYWHALYRQIRISGAVELVSAREADAYFASRARESQIGSYASHQSDPLESREVFDARVKTYEAKFEGMPVPRPDFWGGWRVIPAQIEFWQGMGHRLHDRIVFSRTDTTHDHWNSTLVYP